MMVIRVGTAISLLAPLPPMFVAPLYAAAFNLYVIALVVDGLSKNSKVNLIFRRVVSFVVTCET